MTINNYIAFTEKRLEAESELLANLKVVTADNEKLQLTIKELENGNSIIKTPAEVSTASANSDA